MLSPPLSYQEPKSQWVWPSSSSSTEATFQPPQIPTVHKKSSCYTKILQHFTKNFYYPKKLSYSQKCLKKTANFCRALISFSGPKSFASQKSSLVSNKNLLTPDNFLGTKLNFSTLKNHSAQQRFISRLKSFQVPGKIFQLERRFYNLTKKSLTIKNTQLCINVFSEAEMIVRYPKELHLKR